MLPGAILLSPVQPEYDAASTHTLSLPSRLGQDFLTPYFSKSQKHKVDKPVGTACTVSSVSAVLEPLVGSRVQGSA